MGISYKLEHFEGPLDLLLHLIEKNKVNIYDIPIVIITEQYLNLVSEFLVMAATLIDIKARMLLPREADGDGEETDPRAELVARLLEYKYYKYMSQELKDREIGAERLFYKGPTLPKEVAKYEPPLNLDKLLDGLTLAKLQEIFRSVAKRTEDRVDPIRSRFGNIQKEPISLEDKIAWVLEYAGRHRRFSFRGMLGRQRGRIELVVTFLALLELMKVGKIRLAQEALFDDMMIESLEGERADG